MGYYRYEESNLECYLPLRRLSPLRGLETPRVHGPCHTCAVCYLKSQSKSISSRQQLHRPSKQEENSFA